MKKLLLLACIINFAGWNYLPSHAAEVKQHSLKILLSRLPSPAMTNAQADSEMIGWLDAAKALLAARKDVTLIAADSLDLPIHDYLSTLFSDSVDLKALYSAAQKSKVEAILVLSKGAGQAPSLNIEAKEFPSGIMVDRVSVSLDTKSASSDLKAALTTPFSTLLETLQARRTALGFPFHADEIGVLIATANLEDELLWQNLRKVAATSSMRDGTAPISALRIKIVSSDMISPKINDLCGQGLSWCEQANARVCLFWNPVAQDSQNYQIKISLRPSPVIKPVYEMSAPFRPRIARLCCTETVLDVNSPDALTTLLQNLTASHFSPLAIDPSGVDAVAQRQVDGSRLLNDPLILHQQWLNSFRDGQGDSSQFQSADAAYQNSLALASDAASAKSWLYFNYGGLIRQANQAEKALSLFSKADSLFNQEQDSLGALLCALETAKACSAQKQWGNAKDAYLAALRITQSQSDVVSSAGLLNLLGIVAELQGNSQEATSYYEQSAQLNSKVGDPYKTAQIYSHLGELFLSSGQNDKADEYLSGYLRMARELRSEPALARANFQLGVLLLNQNQLQKALEYFRSAADYMEILSDSAGLARIDNNVGSIYMQLSDFENAQRSYESGLKLSRQSGDAENALRCLASLGDLATQQKRWEGAHMHYDEALQIANDLNNNHEVAVITYAKGLAHLKEGRLKTGYNEIKGAMEINGGPVHEDAEKEQAFLLRLQKIIGEIEEIHEEAKLE